MANLGLQNNNPGNLRDPATGNFQQFSTPEEGQQALINDIKLKQSGQSPHIKPGASIQDFASVWAPSSDKNNTSNYANTLARFLGVNTAYAFDQVPADKLAGAVKVAEGTTAIPDSPKKLSVPDFAQKIRDKYNAYQGVDDTTLVTKFLTKYPVYKDRVDITNISDTTTDNTQTTPAPEQSIGSKILGVAGTLTGTQGAGEDIGGALAASGNQDKFDQVESDHEQIAANLVNTIKQKEGLGQDTSKLKTALQQLIESSPKLSDFIPDAAKKTTAQIAADFAQLGLSVGTVGIGTPETALGRIGVASALGAGMGGVGAVQGGDTSLGGIAKSTAIGGVLGAAGGVIGEGVSKAFGKLIPRNVDIDADNSEFKALVDKFAPATKSEISKYGDERYTATGDLLNYMVQNKDTLGADILDKSGEVKNPTDWTRADMQTVMQNAKPAIYKEYTDALQGADLERFSNNVKLETEHIASKLEDQMDSTISKTTQNGMQNIIDELRSPQMENATPETLYDYIKSIGKRAYAGGMDENKAILANTGGELTNLLDKSLESENGSDFAEGKAMYRAAKVLDNSWARAATREINGVSGLRQKLADAGASFEGIKFLLTHDPASLAASVAAKGTAKYLDWLQSPNRALQTLIGSIINKPSTLSKVGITAGQLLGKGAQMGAENLINKSQQ